jgi:hypothetical protein
MRLLIAGFALLLTTAAALAQAGPGGMPPTPGMTASRIGQSAAHDGDGQTTPKSKGNDKAYESALKNIPNKQYDPWHGVR